MARAKLHPNSPLRNKTPAERNRILLQGVRTRAANKAARDQAKAAERKKPTAGEEDVARIFGTVPSVRQRAALAREAALPMAGREADGDFQKAQLIRANTKFLKLLHAEALAEIRNSR